MGGIRQFSLNNSWKPKKTYTKIEKTAKLNLLLLTCVSRFAEFIPKYLYLSLILQSEPPLQPPYRRHLLRKALREQTMTASLDLSLSLSTFFFSVSPTAALVISTLLYWTRFPTSLFPFRSKRGNFVAWAAIKPAAGKEGPWGNKNREEVFFKKRGKVEEGGYKMLNYHPRRKSTL